MLPVVNYGDNIEGFIKFEPARLKKEGAAPTAEIINTLQLSPA